MQCINYTGGIKRVLRKAMVLLTFAETKVRPAAGKSSHETMER